VRGGGEGREDSGDGGGGGEASRGATTVDDVGDMPSRWITLCSNLGLESASGSSYAFGVGSAPPLTCTTAAIEGLMAERASDSL
jgi:hypothetical protein